MKVIVIGGGVVGLATALQIQTALIKSNVIVLEKELSVGLHQTGNNSGVLHCGLYYKPGSYKATLAVSGIQQMIEFCQRHNIKHEVCGKLIVASYEKQLPILDTLFERGVANGLRGLSKLSREEMLEVEPHVGGIAGIHVPQEGIVDYKQVSQAMLKEIQVLNGQVITCTVVLAIHKRNSCWILETNQGEFEADFIINCAGLHCDRVSQMAGEKRNSRIIPFRGEYYRLRKSREHLVKHLIYPVPDPQYPFLGVHFTRLIHGGIEAGPNAVLALAREGYHKRDFDLRDTIDILGFKGFWSFVFRHKRMCIEELRRSYSKKLFCQSLQELIPDIQESDLEIGGAGVRAQALTPNGQLVQDFLLIQRPNALHILNAPSPAATASLAIGKHISNVVAQTVQP